MNVIRSALIMTLALTTSLDGAIPARAAEVRWAEHLYRGFEQAVADSKPLVVYFTADRSEWGVRMDKEVIGGGCLDPYASNAIFVRAEGHIEDDKGNYAQLKRDLKIDKLPTVVVLDVKSAGISECGRIVGFFERETFSGHFKTIFDTWLAAHPEALTQTITSNPFLPVGWSMYTVHGLGFHAAFPGTPKVLLADNAARQYSFGATTPDGAQRYTLVVQDAKTDDVREGETVAWLKQHADTCAKLWNGSAARFQMIEATGALTCEFAIQTREGNQIAHVRAVMTNNRVYTLIAMTSGESSSDLNPRIFFQLFQPIAATESPSAGLGQEVVEQNVDRVSGR